MNENQKKILEMLSEKKITVEEADRLLSLVGKESPAGTGETRERKGLPKYLRVVVTPKEDSGAESVNIRVPVALLRAGMKLAYVIPPLAYNKIDSALKEKGIEFDWRNIKPENVEEILSALNDLEVDVQSGKETVRIYAE